MRAMIRFPRLSLTLAPYVLWVSCSPSLRAEQPFLERYALAPDRAAVLKDLIPGTDDYFFYSALFHQTQGDPQKATALLKAWEEASSGPNGRRDILKNRAALLSYDKDPAGTLAWLREKLALSFDHQRETEEARAELVSTLDPAFISFAAFEKQALADTEDLSKITDAGLYRLTQPVEKWKLTEIRALLTRLTRPDFPKLVDIIDRELKEKDAAFGKFPIHTLLTSDQLADLQKRRPALLNNEAFTSAVLTRLRPLEFEDPERDPAVRGAWLERLWAYAATLPPKHNPLRANLLYHLLAHDERLGKLDPKRLLATSAPNTRRTTPTSGSSPPHSTSIPPPSPAPRPSAMTKPSSADSSFASSRRKRKTPSPRSSAPDSSTTSSPKPNSPPAHRSRSAGCRSCPPSPSSPSATAPTSNSPPPPAPCGSRMMSSR